MKVSSLLILNLLEVNKTNLVFLLISERNGIKTLRLVISDVLQLACFVMALQRQIVQFVKANYLSLQKVDATLNALILHHFTHQIL